MWKKWGGDRRVCRPVRTQSRGQATVTGVYFSASGEEGEGRGCRRVKREGREFDLPCQARA
jgi:hypothetical protein